MLVRQSMSKPVIVVKPRDSAAHARLLLERHRINQLPVVVNGRLVGIVTDRDLRDAFPSVLQIFGRRRDAKRLVDPDRIEVEAVMRANVLTVGPDDSVANAATIMRRERIGALPVVENGHVVGLLSRSDVLDAYVDLARAVGAPRAAAARGRDRTPGSAV